MVAQCSREAARSWSGLAASAARLVRPKTTSMVGATALPFQTWRSMRSSCAAPAKPVANGSVGQTQIRRQTRLPWPLSLVSA
jgi:hypothetical protein